MMAVVKDRAKLKPHAAELSRIRSLAESCCRQLTGWEGALQKLPFDGPRHLPEKERRGREQQRKADDFRQDFLRMLKPGHPLYDTPEARAARGDGKGQMADGKGQGEDGEGQRKDGKRQREDGEGQQGNGGGPK